MNIKLTNKHIYRYDSGRPTNVLNTLLASKMGKSSIWHSHPKMVYVGHVAIQVKLAIKKNVIVPIFNTYHTHIQIPYVRILIIKWVDFTNVI